MKEVSNIKRGLSFGVNSVNAGQRNVTLEPQVIATSTEGSFRLTPAITKFLQLEQGDYVAFANNVDNIDNAIIARNEEIVAFCAENGLDINSPEASVAIHHEFDTWLIYKGIREYDAKGNPKTIQERLTKNDRVKYVNANFDAMMAAAMSSQNESLIASLTREDISEEEQVALLCPFVEAKSLPKYSGSKLANAAGLTGYGTVLNFTDTNVWGQLKYDLGEKADKINRTYDISLKPIEEDGSVVRINVSNGYQEVEVVALVLGSYSDSAPVARSSKESAEAAE